MRHREVQGGNVIVVIASVDEIMNLRAFVAGAEIHETSDPVGFLAYVVTRHEMED